MSDDKMKAGMTLNPDEINYTEKELIDAFNKSSDYKKGLIKYLLDDMEEGKDESPDKTIIRRYNKLNEKNKTNIDSAIIELLYIQTLTTPEEIVNNVVDEAKEELDGNLTRCSFCGKSSNEVEYMVGGPEGLYICDECVDACSYMIDEKRDGREE